MPGEICKEAKLPTPVKKQIFMRTDFYEYVKTYLVT